MCSTHHGQCHHQRIAAKRVARSQPRHRAVQLRVHQEDRPSAHSWPGDRIGVRGRGGGEGWKKRRKCSGAVAVAVPYTSLRLSLLISGQQSQTGDGEAGGYRAAHLEGGESGPAQQSIAMPKSPPHTPLCVCHSVCVHCLSFGRCALAGGELARLASSSRAGSGVSPTPSEQAPSSQPASSPPPPPFFLLTFSATSMHMLEPQPTSGPATTCARSVRPRSLPPSLRKWPALPPAAARGNR